MEIIKVALSSLLSAAAIYVIAKVQGHRQLSQLDLFDYINGITMGSIAAELATELENPIQPLVALAVYGLVSVLLSYACSKWPRVRKYVNGTPTVIFSDGKLWRHNLKKAKLDLTDFLMLCRLAGYFDLSELRCAIFEYNGQLTFLPKSNKRPATPEDMNLSPEPAKLYTELIMDGRIMGENLGRIGKDEKWLTGLVKNQGYSSPKQVFLGLADEQGNLTLYGNENQ